MNKTNLNKFIDPKKAAEDRELEKQTKFIEDKSRFLIENGLLFWTHEFISSELDPLINSLHATYDTYYNLICNFEIVGKSLTEILEELIDTNPPLTIKTIIRHTMLLTDMGVTPLGNIRQFFVYKTVDSFNVILNNIKYRYELDKKNGILSRKIKTNYLDPTKPDEEKLRKYYYELILLLFFGSKIDLINNQPTTQNLNMGDFLGNKHSFDEHLKKRYIHISRQIQGAKAVYKGTRGEHIVKDRITNRFSDDIDQGRLKFVTGNRIPGIKTQKDLEDKFDTVLQIGEKFIALEISFQETNNSVIERKGGQAKTRYDEISKKITILPILLMELGIMKGREVLSDL